MRRQLNYIILVGLLILPVAAGKARGPLERLTGTETLRAIIAEKTVYGSFGSPDDGWIEYHDAVGKSAYYETRRHCVIPGTWVIENNLICYRYHGVYDDPSCYGIVRQDGKLGALRASALDIMDEKEVFWFSTKPGNPEKYDLDLNTCGMS